MADDAVVDELAIWEVHQIVFYTRIKGSSFKIKSGVVSLSEINKIILKMELDEDGFEDLILEIMTSTKKFYVNYQIDVLATKFIGNNFFTENIYFNSTKRRIPIVLYEKSSEK